MRVEFTASATSMSSRAATLALESLAKLALTPSSEAPLANGTKGRARSRPRELDADEIVEGARDAGELGPIRDGAADLARYADPLKEEPRDGERARLDQGLAHRVERSIQKGTARGRARTLPRSQIAREPSGVERRRNESVAIRFPRRARGARARACPLPLKLE